MTVLSTSAHLDTIRHYAKSLGAKLVISFEWPDKTIEIGQRAKPGAPLPPSDLTSALPISCGMPVTSAFPMQKARCPSLMPVFVHPRGKHCSWSSSLGTRRRIVKRKISHFEAS